MAVTNNTATTPEVDGCAPDCAERTTCPRAGEVGHIQCGTCPTHHQPRHHCGCLNHPAGRCATCGHYPVDPEHTESDHAYVPVVEGTNDAGPVSTSAVRDLIARDREECGATDRLHRDLAGLLGVAGTPE